MYHKIFNIHIYIGVVKTEVFLFKDFPSYNHWNRVDEKPKVWDSAFRVRTGWHKINFGLLGSESEYLWHGLPTV